MIARALICWIALNTLTCTSFAEEPKVTRIKPTVVLDGTHSAIRREKVVLVTGEVGWKDVWAEHRGKEHDPAFTEQNQTLSIDFDTHYVVAIFTGCDSGLVVTTFARGDDVLVRFVANGYQTEGRPLGSEDKRTAHQKAKEAAVADYCFVVLPKPVKTIVIEQDVRRELPSPPLWKERFRFPAPKDKK